MGAMNRQNPYPCVCNGNSSGDASPPEEPFSYPCYTCASGMSASTPCALEVPHASGQASARNVKRSNVTTASTLRTEQSTLTTIMLRNLPNDCSRDMVLELLDSEGFKDRYNFF